MRGLEDGREGSRKKEGKREGNERRIGKGMVEREEGGRIEERRGR